MSRVTTLTPTNTQVRILPTWKHSYCTRGRTSFTRNTFKPTETDAPASPFLIEEPISHSSPSHPSASFPANKFFEANISPSPSVRRILPMRRSVRLNTAQKGKAIMESDDDEATPSPPPSLSIPPPSVPIGSPPPSPSINPSVLFPVAITQTGFDLHNLQHQATNPFSAPAPPSSLFSPAPQNATTSSSLKPSSLPFTPIPPSYDPPSKEEAITRTIKFHELPNVPTSLHEKLEFIMNLQL